MLSFDGKRIAPPSMQDMLKEFTKKNTPDQVECGENNEHWIYVRRSTKELELVSKVTGRTEHKCLVKDAEFKFKQLTPAQVSAAKAGLAL